MARDVPEIPVTIRPECLELCETAAKRVNLHGSLHQVIANNKEALNRYDVEGVEHAARTAEILAAVLGDALLRGVVTEDEAKALTAEIEAMPTETVADHAGSIIDRLSTDLRLEQTERLFESAQQGLEHRAISELILSIRDEMDAEATEQRQALDARLAEIHEKHGTVPFIQKPVAERRQEAEDTIETAERFLKSNIAALGRCATCTGPVPAGNPDEDGKKIFSCPAK